MTTNFQAVPNMLDTWISHITKRDNDAALLYVLYMDCEQYRASQYGVYLKSVEQMQALHVTERKARALCHLIKRATERECHSTALRYAKQLNELVRLNALTLANQLRDEQSSSPKMH
ncbi:hypothetical protein [Vibrio sp. Hal054]|uniref:hypothetical protein n=1 Tax=Vibrio sp. Hal054 TaxID=3035158 RepID=UPI00301C6332